MTELSELSKDSCCFPTTCNYIQLTSLCKITQTITMMMMMMMTISNIPLTPPTPPPTIRPVRSVDKKQFHKIAIGMYNTSRS